MKNIVDTLNESLITEHADKAMRDIFGKEITLSDKLRSKFSKLGMNFLHIYDRFSLYEDGCLKYENEKLFTGEICAKVYKVMLNRIIPVNDDKIFKVYGDDMSGEFDMKPTPKYYLRAILNALTNKHYSHDGVNIVIDDIDYTSGDFQKDSSKDVA